MFQQLKVANQLCALRRIVLPGLILAAMSMVCFNAHQALALGDPWEQTRKFFADDGESGDGLGSYVAISGTTAIAGAIYDEDNGHWSGSAYLFNTMTGEQLFKLLPDDGAADDWFGTSVGICGSTAIVGAWGNSDNGDDSGSAYLFDTTTGEQLFKLLADDGAEGDGFGSAVAISGNIAIVGASHDDDNSTDSGSVYVFDITTGEQRFKLHANDAKEDDHFGRSVAISGNTIIIGTPGDDRRGWNAGAAYIFDAVTGEQLFKVRASDGSWEDFFGVSVAISGNAAIVGAEWQDDNGAYSGSAYVFDTAAGKQRIKLIADDGESMDEFGHSVAISGSTAIVGTRDYSAYVFDPTIGGQFKLPVDGGGFGHSVAISGTTIVVGASFDGDNGNWPGSVYVFERTDVCLSLAVENLIAGQNTTFTITGGQPGSKCVTVYGIQPGQTTVDNNGGFCATISINNVKAIGELNQTFDATGTITFDVYTPSYAAGAAVYFQSAMQGTCPDECISNLITDTVQ